jgi:biopolymer transport protein ExbD
MPRRIAKPPTTVDEPVVNLTPLIDVVFVILIMFIVVAPLLELDRVDLADAARDPMEGSIAVSENSPISIHVRKDNTVWFNQTKVNPTELTNLLIKAKKRYPKARPQLFHDRTAHFGTYQSVKNAAEAAGFEQMDVVLKPS